MSRGGKSHLHFRIWLLLGFHEAGFAPRFIFRVLIQSRWDLWICSIICWWRGLVCRAVSYPFLPRGMHTVLAPSFVLSAWLRHAFYKHAATTTRLSAQSHLKHLSIMDLILPFLVLNQCSLCICSWSTALFEP